MTHDQASYLDTLAEFTSRLLTSYDVDSVLGELASRTTRVLDLAGCGVTLAREGRLEFVAGVPDDLAALEHEQTAGRTGPCVEAFRTAEIVAVEDLAAYHELWPGYLEVADRVGVRAVAGIPMCLENQVVGAVNLYSDTVRIWTRRDLAAARVLANLATVFVINASMYDTQKRLAEQLQGALDSRIVIEQAKGVLANHHGISVDAAFERIRRHARRHSTTVRAVAEAIMNVGLRPD